MGVHGVPLEKHVQTQPRYYLGVTSQIVVQDLVKTYRVSERASGLWGALRGVISRRERQVHALDGVSFSIESGELVGYIGPNGAGKSSTLKILSGILVPDSGRCHVLGRTPWLERIAHVAQIGVVFGQRTQLWWDLPVIESFSLIGEIYRVPPLVLRKAVEEMVDLLELQKLLDVPVRQLSLGQRMRCDLAAALLHSPPILFLDEPTIGLDAQAKLAVRDVVRRLNREHGVTVILTTHDLDDIEALCSRVLVISSGKILFDGALDALRAKISADRHLIVDLVEQNDVPSDAGARLVQQDGHRATLAFDPRQVSAAELIARITKRHAVRDLFVENPPIEELIAALYQNEGEFPSS
jgi:ABC-2 type transport system ATP-binding protein